MTFRTTYLVGVLAALCTASSASADIVLNFDGLQDGEFINNFYNGGLGSLGSGPGPSDGVVFPVGPEGQGFAFTVPNTVAAPPSGPNALFWGEAGAWFDVSAGFTGSLSFFYLTAEDAAKAVTIYDGSDLSGNILAQVDLKNTSPNGVEGAQPAQWVEDTITFNGTAKSVFFHDPLLIVDNITIPATSTATPEPSTVIPIAAVLLVCAWCRRRIAALIH